MLVKELKNVISHYNEKEKDKIIIELYKRIPKSVKEYDIDNFLLTADNEEKIKKEEKNISVDDLFKEVEYFILCANKGLYAEPNKVISKKERSNWRFKAKRYYKELTAISSITDEGQKATDFLKELYIVLSVGTSYLRFSSWNTFGAMGVSQIEFIKMLMQRKLVSNITDESIAYCVDLILMEFDSNEWHTNILISFVDNLPSDAAKNMALIDIKNRVKKLEEKLASEKLSSSREYDIKNDIRNLAETVLFLSIDLNDVKNGIKYLRSHLNEHKEVREYIILERLEMFELYDEWIEEYESHKIDYRDELKQKYLLFKKKVAKS